jgi:hypothetical protein
MMASKRMDAEAGFELSRKYCCCFKLKNNRKVEQSGCVVWIGLDAAEQLCGKLREIIALKGEPHDLGEPHQRR